MLVDVGNDLAKLHSKHFASGRITTTTTTTNNDNKRPLVTAAGWCDDCDCTTECLRCNANTAAGGTQLCANSIVSICCGLAVLLVGQPVVQQIHKKIDENGVRASEVSIGHYNRKDNDDIQREVRNLFMRTNMLVRRFINCYHKVKIILFRSYCVCLYV